VQPLDYSNPNEYNIACMLGVTREPDAFVGWPSHITVIPWFDIDTDDLAIIALQRVAAITKRFTAEVGREDHFGKLTVNHVESPDLHTAHNLLVGEIENLGGDNPFPQYILDNYRPHITRKRDKLFHPGDQFCIEGFVLVKTKRDEPRQTRLKRVVAEVELWHE
jgi:2'-5' RNA ligase